MNEDEQTQLRLVFANAFDFFIDTFHHVTFDTSLLDKTKEEGLFCAVLYNDELHNYDEVITTVQNALDTDDMHGYRVATAIDEKGRDIIHSGTKEECLKVAVKVKAIGLHVVVLKESFVEQQEKACELMDFVYDLALNEEYNRPPELQGQIEMIFCQELLKAWHTRLENVDSAFRFVQLEKEYDPNPKPESTEVLEVADEPKINRVANALGLSRFLRIQDQDDDSSDSEEGDEEEDEDNLNVFKGRLKPSSYELPKQIYSQLPELNAPSFCHFRLDYIMYYHRKTWKAFRIILNEMILRAFCFTNTLVEVKDDMDVTTNHNNIKDYKLAIPVQNRRDIFGVLYFKLYPLILWQVLFKEREPYNTINELGVQILTVPSIANNIESKFKASWIFGEMLTASVLYGQKTPFSTVVKCDSNSTSFNIIDANKEGIRKGIYQKIIHDLLFFINTPEIRLIIQKQQSPTIFDSFVFLLTLVNGMDHQLKYTREHIPFDSRTWQHAFNLTLNLYLLQKEIVLIPTKESIHNDIKYILSCASYLKGVSEPIDTGGVSVHCTVSRFLSQLLMLHPSTDFLNISHTSVPNMDTYLVLPPSDPHAIIISQLAAIFVYYDKVTSLFYLRNGQTPFYQLSLLKMFRQGQYSMFLLDIYLLQRYHLQNSIFPVYFNLMGFSLKDYMNQSDQSKYNILLENSLLFMGLMHTKWPTDPINDFLNHVLAIRPHTKSELTDYFDTVPDIQQYAKDNKYQSNSKINPFHYAYNRSNSKDAFKLKLVDLPPNGSIDASYFIDVKESLSIEILLGLALIGNQPHLLQKLLNKSVEVEWCRYVIQQAKMHYNLDLVHETLDIKPKRQMPAHLLDKIKQNELLAVNAYKEEMDLLSDEEDVCCSICKHPLVEEYGYMAYLSINPKKEFLVNGCHLVHYKCLYLPKLDTPIGNTYVDCLDMLKYGTSCPICRGLVNCFIPVESAKMDEFKITFDILKTALCHVFKIEVNQVVHVETPSEHELQFINDCKSFLGATSSATGIKLIELPLNYEDFFLEKIKCLKCDSTPDNPALCLVCGTITCFQDVCCISESVYEPVIHQCKCTYSFGMFLMVKQCTIALTCGQIYYILNAPYWNKDKERDNGLKRGKPMKLIPGEVEMLQVKINKGQIPHMIHRMKRQ